ncbi:hypothetical protein K435DRAFT_787074 [Dendrothele bispora CBS 962.96]|uniref:Uncharacterized protein n=1 Tax=Dendrothele bispora (strain CBS 962.96) TaxID=1314807 RepID=A0A4S8KMF3_DENBC|nr:hypothetical protein K435DRAFT_787074 [Dendrothele bispora CBS 962.96]
MVEAVETLLMPSPWFFLISFCISIPTSTSPLMLTPQKISTHFPTSFSSIFEQILTNFTTRRPCD